MTVTELPRPAAKEDLPGPTRWIPTRAGIVNVWRYYDEVFEFHDGRLLLRGPNGSGKSKALELLLPFLFDANLRANRLSTFGTAERTMHWNLMGEGTSGTTRVGYVWVEFQLPGAEDRWFTCGARLQAGSHTPTVHPDYFTTALRVGRENGISLVNDTGAPLTRLVLQERLGAAGTVHATAADYRADVRASLFPALTEQRFDALITALLQLRTPKLSQRLDPALLSTLLSRALPPLGQEEIADLAEGFERLDAQRERLSRLADEVAATRTLARHQRTYAQRVLRAGAAAVISATTELDKLAAAARDSTEEYNLVDARMHAAREHVDRLTTARGQAAARRDGLADSAAYKQGRELDQLRSGQVEAAARARQLGTEADAATSAAEHDAQQQLAAARAAQQHAETVRIHDTDTHQAASRAGLASVYDELRTADAAPSRSLLRAALRGKRSQIETAARSVDRHERAVERRRDAEDDLELARSTFADAEHRLHARTTAREQARTELGAAVRSWTESCRELVFTDPDALTEHVESEPALLMAVNAVAAPLLREITRQETTLEAQLTVIDDELDDATAESQLLSDEHDITPTAPTARTTDRSHMVGAPLWQLVDFVETTPVADRAGIEAALQDSGLLDAWIGPRGQLEGHDRFADPYALAPVNSGTYSLGAAATATASRSLVEVLIPAADAAVDAGVVLRLLQSIGLEDRLTFGAGAAVCADGSWRVGNLRGSAEKGEPAYIGAATRAQARLRRSGELQARITEFHASIARLNKKLADLALRRTMIQHEIDALPSHDDLVAAVAQRAAAEADLHAADVVIRGRVSAVAAREQGVKTALLELTSLAAETGLPTERDALAGLAAAVDAFGEQAESWLAERAQSAAAHSAAAILDEHAQRSAVLAQQRAHEAAAAATEHGLLSARLHAIDNARDTDYREVLAEIATLRTTLGELDEQLQATRDETLQLAGRLGELDARRGTDAAARDTAAVGRDRAAHRFRELAGGILPADSEIRDLPRFEATLAASDGVRAALEAARIVAAAWPSVPHAPSDLGNALHRLSESVHECRTTLSARADLNLETDSDVQIFTAVVDGVRVGAAELLAILSADAERSRLEITEQERELFDQTLTGDTRRHLASRIRQANELVDGMNARLERVRTASHVAVRLVWQVAADLPAGTKAARDLLLKDPERLTDADRDALHRFLRDRIEEAKADDSATSWEQQLAQVFDYTAWHRFVVKVDRAGGDGWQLLTKKLHGALSGGEKAIALHLPLFAAVAAHYQAAPQCPRVILLDEVFVGVDTVNRGQIFALLAALDLDLMLTSDHEWCTYAELPGIGIHQLITGSDGDDAVTTARFTWNGSQLAAD